MSKVLSLPWKTKLLFCQIIAFLIVFQACVRTLSLSTIISLFKLEVLHNQPAATPATTPATDEYIKKISWAIQAVRKRFWFLPGQCLAQALTARHLLKKHHIPSQLFLGTSLTEEKALNAHAWLVANNIIVTGSDGADQHTAIATFR